MKRRIMTLALIISIIIMNIVPIVNASSTVNATLSTSKTTVEMGDSLNLSVILSEGNLKSYGIKILFDSSIFECVSKSENNIVVANDYVKVSKTSTADDLAGGNIANITFKVKETAGIGTKTFTIDSSESTIERLDGGNVKGNLGRASVTIKEKYIASSNANLSSLKVNKGTLTPSFDKNITSYNLTVDYSVESIVLSATAEDSKSKSVSGTGNKNLNVGNNSFVVTVVAEDGTTKKYTLNVTRNKDPRSSNTNLKTLTANRTDILKSKTLTVKNTVSSIEIVAKSEDEKSKVSGDLGIKQLNVGENKFKITVTAENGDTKEYDLTIVRSKAEVVKIPSTNANLRSLLVDGTVVTGFSPATHTYEIKVDKNKTTAVISAVKDDENSTLSGTGTVSLDYGTNTFTVRVIAENGKTNNIYVLNIVRGAKTSTSSVQTNEENSETQAEELKITANNYLKSLEINHEGLSPEFNKDVSAYTLVVGMDVENIDITAVADYEKATIEVVGNTGLVEGLNNITVMVTAEDGTKRVYTISVTKTNNLELANANLQSIVIDGIELLPEFSPNVLEYTCSVGEEITSLNMTVLPTKENANVEITGNENLVPGENIITIVVTAEDGITTKTYVIKVTKEGELKEEMENKAETLVQEDNISAPKEEKDNITLVIVLIIATYSVGILAMFLLYKKEKDLNKATVANRVTLLGMGKDELNKKNKLGEQNDKINSENKSSDKKEKDSSEKQKKNAKTNKKEKTKEGTIETKQNIESEEQNDEENKKDEEVTNK